MQGATMRCAPALLFLLAASVNLHAAPTTPAPVPTPTPVVKPDPKPVVAPKVEAKPVPISPVVKLPPEDAYVQMEMLTRAMEMVRQNYVDESKITYEELVEGALEGMLRRLDPHCEYMGKPLFDDMQREQSDTSEGIGITVALRQNMLTIITVREDGPAAREGALAGDQLLRINDVLTDSVGVAEAMQLLKGKVGEEVRLTVRRPGTKPVMLLELKVKHETLSETSIHDPMLLSPKLTGEFKIGYARISQFNQPTARDLSRALDALEKQGIQAFVLDLRNNPGGLVDSSVAVCGEFLPEGTVVVTTEGRVASQNPPPYRTPARNGREPRKYPIAVLINQGSASASELTAGALQDLKRAIIVGTTSFGKGSVQTILPMKNGAAMRLTTAKYYTPSHRTIHENGVEPNIVSALTPDEESRIMTWRGSHGTGEAAAMELANLGDKQLERAVDSLKGVLVFDAFVARPLAPVAKPFEKAEAPKAKVEQP